MDWRTIEREIVEFFRREGLRPHHAIGTLEPHAGDWIIKRGNKPLRLTALARELAFRIGDSKT